MDVHRLAWWLAAALVAFVLFPAQGLAQGGPVELAGGLLPPQGTSRAKENSHARPLVGITLAANGRSLTIGADANVFCGDGSYREDLGIRDLEVEFGGVFGGSTTYRYRIDRTQRATVDLSINGKLQGGKARGRLRIRVRIDERGRRKPDRCDSGNVAWEAHTAPDPLTLNAPPLGGGRYYGALDQNSLVKPVTPQPLALRVSNDGKAIDGMVVRIALRCNRGDHFETTNFSPLIRIQPDGSFSNVERFRESYDDGTVGRYRVDTVGHFAQGGVTGTYQMHFENTKRGSRRALYACDSGVLNWAATP